MSPVLTNSQTSRLIVAEARKWLGVPYQHQGRDRRGIDCAGVIINVGHALGLLPPDFDCTDYDRWPDSARLKLLMDEHGVRTYGSMFPGDIVMMEFAGDDRHLGILGDYAPAPGELSLIHAYSARPAQKVVEHRLDEKWRKRITRTYSYREQF